MKQSTYPILQLNQDCSLAITSFSKNSYSVFYNAGGCEKNLEIDSFEGFLFHPFIISENQPKLFLKDEKPRQTSHFEDISRFIESIKESEFITNPLNRYAASKKNHLINVRKAIHECKKSLTKVVVSRIQKEELQQDPLQLFEKLCKRYPNNGNYLFYSKETGFWMGSSPETLIEIDHTLGKTVALAGTKANHDEWTKKEKKEQEIVEHYIENIFNEINIPFQSEKANIQLKGIQHIKTNYTFNWSNSISLSKLINNLHPTPAVAGIPKSLAIDYILSLEKHMRRYYTGYFGVLSEQKKKLFVNLRCMEFDANHTYYYLGGGITKDSGAEKEFEETVKKMKSFSL